MNSTNKPFLEGFEKTAGLPKWLHESCKRMSKASLKGHSRRGLKAMLKRRGIK